MTQCGNLRSGRAARLEHFSINQYLNPAVMILLWIKTLSTPVEMSEKHNLQALDAEKVDNPVVRTSEWAFEVGSSRCPSFYKSRPVSILNLFLPGSQSGYTEPRGD